MATNYLLEWAERSKDVAKRHSHRQAWPTSRPLACSIASWAAGLYSITITATLVASIILAMGVYGSWWNCTVNTQIRLKN
jgi:hypothetical protein